VHVISYKSAAQYDGTLRVLFATGQSLGNGFVRYSGAVSTTQPYSNLTLNAHGVLGDLTEPCYHTEDGTVETILSGCCNLLSELLADLNGTNENDEQFAGFTVAKNGAQMSVIEKGGSGANYQDTLDTVTYLDNISTGGAQVIASILIHGEADDVYATNNYDDLIATMADDYDADLRAITSQTQVIDLFLCQMSSWTFNNNTTSIIPGLQWDASKDNANVHLVTPKYHLPYDDGIHLTAEGYRQLGEHYAKAIFAEVWGSGWTPLQPVTCTRSGAVVTLTFDIPATALVLDTTTVNNPGNYGFEWYDAGDGNSVTISSVALAESDTEVDITLSDTPTGTGQQVRYAYTGTSGNDAGATTGARGCLRDNDIGTTSRHGYGLYNWCIHFAMDVS